MKRFTNITKLDAHDLRVFLFHAVVALIQYTLIGLGAEKPAYAPFIQAILELLRRVAV